MVATGVAWSAIAPGSITTAMLRNGAVSAQKIKNRTISRYDINAGAIYGEHVREGTLDTVPKATNSDKLGGLDDDAYVQVNTDTQFWNVANATSTEYGDVVIATAPAGSIVVTTTNGNDPRAIEIPVTNPQTDHGIAQYVKGYRFCYAVDGTMQVNSTALNVENPSLGTTTSSGGDTAATSDTDLTSTTGTCVDVDATPLYQLADGPMSVFVWFEATNATHKLKVFGIRVTYTSTPGG